VLINSSVGGLTNRSLANLFSELGEGSIGAVLITHTHLDHCDGAAGLQSRTDCAVITSREMCVILETGDEWASGLLGRQQGIYLENVQPSACRISMALEHKQQFEAGVLQ